MYVVQAVPATFSESTDLLLDALIAASAKRVLKRTPSPSEMRVLVPFDFAGIDQSAMCGPGVCLCAFGFDACRGGGGGG